MPTFDLTRRKWIPVQTHEGTHHEVSLRTVLVEAHRIREVTSGSPLITVSLYRLLQALALRIVLEAESEDEAKERWLSTWTKGQFDPADVARYFDEWQGKKRRFDLLHEERPFYQHPEPNTKTVKPPTQLFAGQSSGNNPTIFDHSIDADAGAISLAEAARGVVATQATALGGGRSKPFYYSDAPLVTGAIFWIRGDSLFEALLLNTPFSFEARLRPDGKPLWERKAPPREQPEPSKRHDQGYLDYLTWPSRLLHLQTETRGDTPVVTGVKMSQGDKRLAEGSKRDPLMAAAWSENAGEFPLKLRADRALWRDASAFMNIHQEKAGEAPKTLQWVKSQSAVHRKVWWTDVFGLVNDQAKIERWEHARMPIFSTILENPSLQRTLRDALNRAEKQASILRYAARECAAQVLFPGRSYNDLGTQGREEARDAAAAMGTTGRYWARLEEPFLEWLETLATTGDTGLVLSEWTRTAFHVALGAFEDATNSLDASARQMRARAAGRDVLRPAEAYRDKLAG